MDDKLIQFIRQKDYILKEILGQGGCGQTVLLYDDSIDEYFVCKKYMPCDDEMRQTLFSNFSREVKLLYQIHHDNVVRIFNHFLYPDNFAGYILMEHIVGSNIREYLEKYPDQINEIFTQAIKGFCHLETIGILHRDIREDNIMVRNDGVLKIIDFGFGKKVFDQGDFNKSVVVNSWCPSPAEYTEDVYDFSTEVYFIGQLFDSVILKLEIQGFRYPKILQKMCRRDYGNRTKLFSDVLQSIISTNSDDVEFDPDEIRIYQVFSDALYNMINIIDTDAYYIDDIEKIEENLQKFTSSCMLEMYIPNNRAIIDIFLYGAYRYRAKKFAVSSVTNFYHFFVKVSAEKKRIILRNLHTRLDSIAKYDLSTYYDDVPF